TCRCSSRESVALSPVVPHGTSALLPSAICQSTNSRSESSSTQLPEKGVTSAGMDPKNMEFCLHERLRDVDTRECSGTDKEGSLTMSSMRGVALILLLV